MSVKLLLPIVLLLPFALTKPIHQAPIEKRQFHPGFPFHAPFNSFTPYDGQGRGPEITSTLVDQPAATPNDVQPGFAGSSQACAEWVVPGYQEKCSRFLSNRSISFTPLQGESPADSGICRQLLSHHNICVGGSQPAWFSTTTTTITTRVITMSTIVGASSTRTTSVVVTRTRTETITAVPTASSNTVLPVSNSAASLPASIVPSSGSIVPPSASIAPSSASVVPPSASVVPSSASIVPPSASIVPSSIPAPISTSKYVSTFFNPTGCAGAPAIPQLAPTASDGSLQSTCSSTPAPAATQSGIVSGCTQWYQAISGDSCYTVAQTYGLSLDSFMQWNPAVEAPSCQKMLAGLAYCVAVCRSSTTPSATVSIGPSALPIPASAPSAAAACKANTIAPAPTNSGTVPGCLKWYTAQLGDSCYTVALQFDLDLDAFMSSNPSVGPPGCLSLYAGNAYCVAWCGGTSIASSSSALPTSLLAGSSTFPHSTILTFLSSISSSPSSTTTVTIIATSSTAASVSPTTATSSSAPAVGSTTSTSSSASPANPTAGPDDKYVSYCGDGSTAAGWPPTSSWKSFDSLFDANTPNMKIGCEAWGVPNDSDEEISNMKAAILSTADLTGIDARFILAIIMQESTGCVRVITTAYSHDNPGLMQSFNGTGTCNTYNANLAVLGPDAVGEVWTPCPASRIQQQVLDGTNGTVWGPGLRQDMVVANVDATDDAQAYYRTARIYNGGSYVASDLSQPCCTSSYASDVANRLVGWVYAPRNYVCG